MVDIEERESILDLLKLYRSLPALWDVSCDDYSNRSIKEQQYAVLLHKYRDTNPQADKKELTKKINTLRTNYRREAKRIRDAAKGSGDGVNGGYESTLYYYDALKFLSDIDIPSSSNSTSRKFKFKVGSGPPRKKKKIACSTDELVHLAVERLKKPQDACQQMGNVWGHKLSAMDRSQRIIAEKLINEVMFNGELGLLSYDTYLANIVSLTDIN